MQRLGQLVIGFAVAAFILWIGWTSPSLKQCLQEAYYNNPQQPLQEYVTNLYRSFVSYRFCVGDFVHANGDGIIAIFTVILGIATWFLWRATRDLVQEAKTTGSNQIAVARDAANAAQKSASASVQSANLQQESFQRLECPYLFVRITDVHHPERDVYFPSSDPFGNLSDPDYYVRYTFDNFGRTPASIVSVCVALTADPVQSLRLPMAIQDEQYEAVPPGKSMERTMIARIENPAQDFLGADAKMLLLHGLVLYEDPMGALHTYGFLLRGKEGGRRFQVDGGRQYNWRKVAYPKDREEPDYGDEILSN